MWSVLICIYLPAALSIKTQAQLKGGGGGGEGGGIILFPWLTKQQVLFELYFSIPNQYDIKVNGWVLKPFDVLCKFVRRYFILW